MPQRITQRDIAREAGVDVSTVSLCLNRHPRIPEATRLRVLTVAERLGYRPDPALSSIAANRWSQRSGHSGATLAFIADNLKKAEIELKLYLEGVRLQADALGYKVTAFSLTDYPDVAVLLRVLRSRGIRGVVLGQSRQPLPVELFQEMLIPVVHCGYLRDVPGDVVRPDLRQAVANLIESLQETRRRIVCFLPIEENLRSDSVILGAALAQMRMLARGRLRVQVVPPDFTEDHLAALINAQSDAVVTINERQGARIRKETHIPAELLYTLHTLPPTAGKQGMDLRLSDVGRASVNLLEIKLRHQPLAAEPFRQSLLVTPLLLTGVPARANR